MPQTTRLQTTRVLWLALLLGLMAYGLLGELFSWPKTDEGNYLYKSWLIAQGGVPYLDYNEFITPGGQVLTAGLIRLFGLHIVGIRLVIVLCWVLSLVMAWRVGREYLSGFWLRLMLAFLWLSVTRYLVDQHHFWSGFFAFASVYSLTCFMKNPKMRHLVISGLLAGMVPWITQSAGVLMIGSVLAFFALDWLLDKPSARFSRRAIGVWTGMVLLVSAGWTGYLVLYGAWQAFWQDSVVWLLAGHYSGTTIIGYFPMFSEEVWKTVEPLFAPLPGWIKLVFVPRIAIGLQLGLIALLPWLGIAWAGFEVVRAKKTGNAPDRVILLLGCVALAMILSTFSYSTGMHIVSNGMAAFVLAFIFLGRWFSENRLMKFLMAGILAAAFAGVLIGSWMKLNYGIWLPTFSTIRGSLLLPEKVEEADALLRVIERLETAAEQNRSVFIYGQSPELYLAGNYQNATRYSLVIPVYLSAAQEKELVAQLKANPPLYVVTDGSVPALRQDPRFSRYDAKRLQLARLDRYLGCHYMLSARFGRYAVWQELPATLRPQLPPSCADSL